MLSFVPARQRIRSITHGGSTRRLQARYSLAEMESGDTPENALRRALEHEAFRQAESYASADLTEGLAAAAARREPSFEGR